MPVGLVGWAWLDGVGLGGLGWKGLGWMSGFGWVGLVGREAHLTIPKKTDTILPGDVNAVGSTTPARYSALMVDAHLPYSLAREWDWIGRGGMGLDGKANEGLANDGMGWCDGWLTIRRAH